MFWHRTAPAPPHPFSSASAVSGKSIAVLPFESLSSEKENAYFADGVQDEVLTNLARIADLRVISRTSVMQYKSGAPRNLREIGQQLGVAHVLEGSVQRAGGKVRVNAQLIDARTDAHLWAQIYDRPLDDVFAIQSEIATAIADQLKAKLSPSEKEAIERPPTTDVVAFDLYTRANNLLLSNTIGPRITAIFLQAVELLDQAVARDPSFFQAYCQLVFAHDNLYFQGRDRTPARRALADAALQAAHRLRPDVGEMHLARAGHLYRGYLDYAGALGELDLAQRALPNDARVPALRGFIARRQGRFEESLPDLSRALALDPRNVFLLQQTAVSYKFLRRYRECADLLDRCLAVVPDDANTLLARAEIEWDWKVDTRPLHQTIDAILAREPGAIQDIGPVWLGCALAERDVATAERALIATRGTAGGDNPYTMVLEGLLAWMIKDEARSRAAFTRARTEQEKKVQVQPDDAPALALLGLIDAGLGRKEEALQEGRRAMELLPVAKDPSRGVDIMERFAMIAAWVGEKELACEQLAIVARLPGSLDFGHLKLDPEWDPLRGEPCFEEIVASLTPKA